MKENEWWKQKAPVVLVTFFWMVTIYFGLWAWVKCASFFVTEQKGEEIYYFPILFGSSPKVPIFGLIAVSIWSIFGWLLSTRVSFYQSRRMRVISFFSMGLTVWGGIAAYGMSEARMRMLPFFEARLLHVFDGSIADAGGILEELVLGQVQGFNLMITIIPVLILFFVTYFLMNKYIEFDKELNSAFFHFEWKGRWLQKLAKLEKKNPLPDMELGPNSKTGELVIIPGGDRTVGTLIVGSPGTGKTAALATPMLEQDLDHMVNYINDYPSIYEREDFKTQEVGGRYLSGMSVIDPSNDLCQDVLKLVKAHGIPDEAITYINPLDPDTPSINPMRGPVDKVAEVFAQVIAGLNDSKDGGNFFFEQAQRNHLKHYIYLLKLHDTEKEVTLDMLLDMYNNPQMVRSMHVALKTTIPTGIDAIVNRDERNYWKIVQGIDEWFDMNLLPKQTRSGPVMIPEYDDYGNALYYDAKEEHVQGLRNILNDIGANPLIRRVLFGESDFDFDRHMEVGGVLLVNTAKGDLVNLARVLGKIVLMNLQNATFRRTPKVSTFHHILVDEAPDYLYNSFREFPAQSRKYKVIITTLQQTIAQLADQFGEHYMTTVIGTLRNRMVYGDVPGFDADYFSKMFGEKTVYEEGQSEMSVSPLQEDPVSRSGSSYSKVREQAMTSGDIMFQEAFQCAVKIVVKNKPMPVMQVDANFVKQERFVEAKLIADKENVDVWLESRRNYGVVIPQSTIVSIETTEEINKEFYNDSETEMKMDTESIAIEHKDVLDPHMVERAVNTPMDTHPRSEVRYRNGVAEMPTPTAPSVQEKVQIQKEIATVREQLAPTGEVVNTSVASMDTIVDVVLPKVSNQNPSKGKVENEPPVVEKEELSNTNKGGLGSLIETYVEEAAPTVRHGYTESKVNEKGEDFLKEIHKLTEDGK